MKTKWISSKLSQVHVLTIRQKVLRQKYDAPAFSNELSLADAFHRKIRHARPTFRLYPNKKTTNAQDQIRVKRNR